jgi:hypothetical protein
MVLTETTLAAKDIQEITQGTFDILSAAVIIIGVCALIGIGVYIYMQFGFE